MQRKWLVVSTISSTLTLSSVMPMVFVSKMYRVCSWVRRLPSMWLELYVRSIWVRWYMPPLTFPSFSSLSLPRSGLTFDFPFFGSGQSAGIFHVFPTRTAPSILSAKNRVKPNTNIANPADNGKNRCVILFFSFLIHHGDAVFEGNGGCEGVPGNVEGHVLVDVAEGRNYFPFFCICRIIDTRTYLLLKSIEEEIPIVVDIYNVIANR